GWPGRGGPPGGGWRTKANRGAAPAADAREGESVTFTRTVGAPATLDVPGGCPCCTAAAVVGVPASFSSIAAICCSIIGRMACGGVWVRRFLERRPPHGGGSAAGGGRPPPTPNVVPTR